MPDITYTLTRGEQTITLDVEYDVAAYLPATWHDPAEGGELTELHVKFEGTDFTLTDAERDALEQHIYETHDYSDDGYDPEGDHLADRSLD